jgi:hypothetical protein
VGAVAEAVERELLTWPGVSAAPHRFGGREYRFGGKELGHLHGDRLADLLFPVRIRKELVAAGRAQPHHVLPETGWVSFHVTGVEDIPALLGLFRLNYERLARTSGLLAGNEAAHGGEEEGHDKED